ncbi:MAG: MmgE/PrpD family protein [Actinomycetota bacterium]|nr:MmgE/PrpD family protein [Actinomycetota bacterium]
MTLTESLAAWASGLELDEVPSRVVAYAKSQILSQLAAVRAGLGHPLGAAITRAFGSPLGTDPVQSAYVLAALTVALEFDDTVYAGHISHSTVNVPVAYARRLDLDGRRLLTAVIAGNECAARVTAAATLGPFRSQTAAHAHLVGSVASRLRAEGAWAEQWVNALGLAFALPPWSLLRPFLGSDAKVLTAAVPVRMGLDACDGAAAGLAGAPDVLEHPDGFLSRFAAVPLPDAVTAGLGRRWHTETLSFHLYPAATNIYSSVDCAVALHQALAGCDPDEIEEVVVHASLFTVGATARTIPYLDGADSPVSSLQYSVPYSVATALLTGDLTPDDFAPPAVGDPARWALAGKVRVEHDPALTERAALGATPIGEALRQAGDRAAAWVERPGFSDASRLMSALGPPSETFENAEKSVGARIVVRLADGRELVRESIIPKGTAGPETRARHPQLLREKFLGSGGSAEVADAVATLEDASAEEVADVLERALTRPSGESSHEPA